MSNKRIVEMRCRFESCHEHDSKVDGDYMYSNSMQIKRIHTLRRALNMDETTYRAMLASYDVLSSVGLQYDQAQDLIKKMQQMTSKTMSTLHNNKKRYEDLAGRTGDYPSPAQLRLIEATWMSHPNVHTKTVAAMNAFIFSVTKISDIRFILKKDVGRVLSAIKGIAK